MIRDEDAQLTGYVYIDLNTHDYGGFVEKADRLLREKLKLPAGFTYKWSGEYEFELRAKQRLKLILPVVFFVIFLLLYMVFHSVTEAAVLIFPTLYAMTGGLILRTGSQTAPQIEAAFISGPAGDAVQPITWPSGKVPDSGLAASPR